MAKLIVKGDEVEIKYDTTNENIVIDQIYHIILNAGFTFSLPQITNYYLSLKTKPFVILTGISEIV
jgi:hypothetical protein